MSAHPSLGGVTGVELVDVYGVKVCVGPRLTTVIPKAYLDPPDSVAGPRVRDDDGGPVSRVESDVWNHRGLSIHGRGPCPH